MNHADTERIAVFRALQLGDLLCAVPALRALRAARPRAQILLIGLPWAAEFAARFAHYLDGFRTFPGAPGLPEADGTVDPGRVVRFLGEMQAEGLDLAIQLHGSGTITNPLVQLFGARHTAGHFLPGAYRPDPARFRQWPEQGREVSRLLGLMNHLGFPARGERPEFPIQESDRAGLRSLDTHGVLGRSPYAVLHPGASVPERRWPPARFAAIADTLVARGLAVVLTGTGHEARLTAEVARRMTRPAIDLAGRTRLGTLAALIESATVLVSNDTGVAHIADGLQTPSVVVGPAENHERWGPADRRLHRLLALEAAVETVRHELLDLLRQEAGPAGRHRRDARASPPGAR